MFLTRSNISISDQKGTYILLIRVIRPTTITIGRLGDIAFEKGLYAYVGSAWGSGGLKARISRHLRKSKKKFWHIDYLLSCKNVYVESIILLIGLRVEHLLAEKLSRIFRFVKGFGASDSPCQSHLFFVDDFIALINTVKNIDSDFVLVTVQ